MGKRKKAKGPQTTCIFCLARPATEKEHVFPKSWYPSTTPATVQFLTVPVCGFCNDDFEVAERTFSTAILMGMDPKNPAVASVMETFQRSWQFEKANSPKEISRRASRLRSLSRKIKYVMRSPNKPAPWRFAVPVVTPAGLHVMASPALRLEHAVTVKICEKLVRGIHYHETGIPLPVNTPIKTLWGKDFPPEFRSSVRRIPPNERLAPGLIYRVLRDDSRSIWVFYIWGQVELAVFAGNPPPPIADESNDPTQQP